MYSYALKRGLSLSFYDCVILIEFYYIYFNLKMKFVLSNKGYLQIRILTFESLTRMEMLKIQNFSKNFLKNLKENYLRIKVSQIITFTVINYSDS